MQILFDEFEKYNMKTISIMHEYLGDTKSSKIGPDHATGRRHGDSLISYFQLVPRFSRTIKDT